ncbi:Lipase, GDSL [Cynara cardunculus var. scolymus]|uniref:Lipase, GDSL n=1 Tax=Cynara cardunculus var. scolymus TaxID=59895 RepID=A0A103XNX7_CYNCS|nr:Lipase, GDSL [Cynara cardunculus var. scolymus]
MLHLPFFLLLLQVLPQKTNGQNFKFPAILVFGDSTVDTGNNNYITTLSKANHYPYGKDFPGHVPTGRFSNGKLAVDLLASLLGVKQTIPPFLQPDLSAYELQTGVCFASAGTGYDRLTAALTRVIPMSQQLNYFKSYRERLKKMAGEEAAQRIIGQALELYNLGCRTLIITGLPPIGCLPIQITAKFKGQFGRTCVEEQNVDGQAYNRKLIELLPHIQSSLEGSKIFYADIYKPIMDMIKSPEKHGFRETMKGCCGTGLLEAGPICTPLTPLCQNSSEYLFFDSIHPSEKAYRYVTECLKKQILDKL